ncbi:MAG: chemotaxis response regulator protein-glutamate methylesterase [Ardenticatenaceae bacterium]|nr:chemotaxis response regulator protein-glutamate methylesterase [Ardenticatenaceae bacterium]MCB9444364.1 chemotaxis response regulator protein-glutamate methylesterase [Ardenticatenaceae bacterium]
MIDVLIVDDSALIRHQLRLILQSDDALQIVGEARNGEEAVALTKRLKPDVITMDLQMPKMDGLAAIQHIMAECPTPIVVVTGAEPDRDAALLEQVTKSGAVMTIYKSSSVGGQRLVAEQLIKQVKLMSQVRVIKRPLRHQSPPYAPVSIPAPPVGHFSGKIKLLAIGSSTGGPAALYKILGQLPANLTVPVVIVQHISFGFVGGLAGWLNGGSQLTVKVAEHGERLQAGTVLLAPDDHHLLVDSFGRVRLQAGEAVGGHIPSVTVLFDSVAQAYGAAAVGVILTGMGRDGADGLKAMRDKGAVTIAQDEGSCVVFGMPKEAIRLGAAVHVVPLDKIAEKVTAVCCAELETVS